MSIEAMKQALEALKFHGAHAGTCDYCVLLPVDPPKRKPCSCGLAKSIESLRQAIEQAEKPVAWMFQHEETGRMNYVSNDGMHTPESFLGMNPRYKFVCALYTAPPQRERIVFPTMLRRMWSGSEVQQWLDDNVNGGKHEPKPNQDICDND